MPVKTVKLLVSYDETKHIISFQKGGGVKEFSYLFLQVFSDVLLDQVALANLKFQRYDDSFGEYVDLKNDETLEEDMKILALLLKQEKQKASPRVDEGETDLAHLGHRSWRHWPSHRFRPVYCMMFPITPLVIYENSTYQMWNQVSKKGDGLMVRDTNNNNVYCTGTFSGGINTIVTTSAINQNFVSLLFKDNGNTYAITVENGQNGPIIKAVTAPTGQYPDSATFAYGYYFSYIFYESKQYRGKYLGSDGNGNTTLVDMKYPYESPNPQALFMPYGL